jgi:hypothetical protein
MKINFQLYIELLEREVERLRALVPLRRGASKILGVDDDNAPPEFIPTKELISDAPSNE